MYFNDINLYYDSKNPNKPLRVTYTCKHCGKEIESLKHFSIPYTVSGVPKYHETTYICDDCYNKVKGQLEAMHDISENDTYNIVQKSLASITVAPPEYLYKGKKND